MSDDAPHLYLGGFDTSPLKSLEWRDVVEHDDWNPLAKASTIIGVYYVGGIGDRWYFNEPANANVSAIYRTRDAAKAAAFEHYCERIRSAFEGW
jgi:hypothetical protein